MKLKSILFLFISTLFVVTNAKTQQAESGIIAKFLVEAGLEYGGDEILKVFFTNGEDQTMRAGQGGFLAVGGQIEFANIKQLMVRGTIGIKYNTTAADNANIRLTRFPINLTPFWKINDDFRLGVGITSHAGVRLKGDGFLDDVNYTSSLGPRFEFGYKWVAVTYTSINYTDERDRSNSAGSIGIVASLTIPGKK